MNGLNLHPDRRADLGLAEILSVGSIACIFYGEYLKNVDLSMQNDNTFFSELGSLTPKRGKDPINLLRSLLANNLSVTLSILALTLEIPDSEVLVDNDAELLALASTTVHEKALREVPPDADKCFFVLHIANPLEDPKMVTRIWNYRRFKGSPPSIDELIKFIETDVN
jgi:hypothetical protein